MNNELLNELVDVFPPLDIALPTRGIFYQPGVLGDGVDPMHIEVRTLGVMDEFKYRDPFLLVSGKAIVHLIHHLCGKQVLLPEEMCEIDIEAILLAARIASYGSILKIVHNCLQMVKSDEEPDKEIICGHPNTVPIDLNQHILRYGPIEQEERFEVVLPRVGQTVYLKPIPYHTTVELMRSVMANRKSVEMLNLEPDSLVMQPDDFTRYEEILNLSADHQIKAILDCIYAVKTRSGKVVEDPTQIGPWIFELPKSDHDVITVRIAELDQDFRKISLIRYECGKCKQENEFNLQMNAEILFLAESEGSPVPMTSSVIAPRNRGTSRTPLRTSRRPRSPSPEQSITAS